jgi:hypothetical protein
VNKKVVLILTLLSFVTSVRACDKNSVMCEKASTTSTQSSVLKTTDQYLFDEAKKAINTNYPEGLDVITRLNHKGFEPAQLFYWQIRLFEENKTKFNQHSDMRNAFEVIKNLSQDGLVPATSFLEKIKRYESAMLVPDREYKKKVKILEDLSKEGFAAAQCAVGRACVTGDQFMDIAKDEKKGVELLQGAASQQEPLACLWLGNMYWDGLRGLQKDKREAVKLWKSSKIQGLRVLEEHNIH